MVYASVPTGGEVSFGSGSGSIIIDSAVEGETYYIYKLLDVTYDANKTSYSYTIDDTNPWYDFFIGTATTEGYVTVANTTGTVTWLVDSSYASAFAELAIAYAQANDVSSTMYAVTADSTGEITFSGLDLGYYLVSTTFSSLCGLTTTNPSATIVNKYSTPTLTKQVYEDGLNDWYSVNTADIGEVVEFRVEISDAKSIENLVLHDEMEDGLTLLIDTDHPLTIKVGSSLAAANDVAEEGVDYTVLTSASVNPSLTHSSCDFEVVFSDTFLDELTDSQLIFVSYYATVNSDADIGYSDGNTNTAWLTYGSGSESTPSLTTTYVYDLYIYKYTGTAEGDIPGTALADAKFVLSKTVLATTYYAYLDSDNKVVEWTPYKTYDEWYAADQQGTAVSNYYATELTTDSTGLVHFVGLDAGTYALTETEAPYGYSLATGSITINISQTGEVDNSVTVGSVTARPIYNGSSSAMPSTGGIGTTIFYIVGGVLVVGAIILLITKKRMKSDDKE